MKRYHATITIERDDDEVDVEVSGYVEGPRYHVDDLTVDEPSEIELSAEETDRAKQALVDAYADDDSDACAAEMRDEMRTMTRVVDLFAALRASARRSAREA